MKSYVILIFAFISIHAFGQSDSLNYKEEQIREFTIVMKLFDDSTISVEKVQLSDWRWKWKFYDRSGLLTFELEEIHGSYSVTLKPEYRADGSVSRIINTTHPGASRFWFENTITMNENNVPLTMVRKRLPIEDLSDLNSVEKHWNPESGPWE